MKNNISKGHEILSLKNESVPLLKNQFLDKFTRVQWYVPLLIYIPIILYFLQKSLIQLSNIEIALFFLLGILLWSITEYTFHRFIFHTVPNSKWGRYLHFMLHGVHHAYPNDALRLVMPPILSLPLSSMFFIIFYCLFHRTYIAIFSGFMSAYLAYDMLHYAVHHISSSKLRWFNSKKSRHMKHHFLHSESEFAVTSPFWDRVFKTLYSMKDNSEQK